MMFIDDEALAISVGLLAPRQLGLAAAAPAVQSAQAKLERVLPATLKTQPRALSETITLDLRASPPANDNEALMTLSTAAHQRQRVHLHYRSPQCETYRESERDFDAYGLAWLARRCSVVGRCHQRNDLRSFRLDRIAQVDVMDARFEAPQAFDAMATKA